MNKSDCNHDYENPIRIGRAHYLCKDCRKDISLELVLMADIEEVQTYNVTITKNG